MAAAERFSRLEVDKETLLVLVVVAMVRDSTRCCVFEDLGNGARSDSRY